jgi:LTXXQ motif family protein
MKSEIIVVFLLCIVAASQTAWADTADVLTNLATITTVVPRASGNLSRDCGLEVDSIAGLKDDIARTSDVRTDPSPSLPGEMLLVAIPFSSLQLSPSLVECLALTPAQVQAIQKLMDQERPTAERLMQELQTTSSELGAAIHQRQSNNNEGSTHKLAARQAHLLKQLLRSNSRLRQRIDRVLSPRQRKELDSFS